MTTVDPRYRADAATAAAIIAGGTPTREQCRGVLAQWVAESGWAYPPARNNPGNNDAGWAQATGYPYTIETPNPQPSDPIVTYPDEATGVASYGKGYTVIARYATALAKFRANDIVGWITEAIAQHYGTGFVTWSDVYAVLAAQEGFFDQGDAMIYTGGPSEDKAAIHARYRYPITSGTKLYMGAADAQYFKSFSGTAGNARFLGPVAQKWSDATWKWGAVIIGTSAADPAGTILYIKAPDKSKVIDTGATV